MRATGADQQKRVDAHFAGSSDFWSEIYGRSDGESVRFRTRHDRTLRLIDQLQLPSGAHALDLGAGAGFTTIALAQRGLLVDAVDSVPDMVAQVSESANRSGLATQVNAHLGDAHAVPAENESYDVVLSLGVMPWLHNPAQAMAEMARVLKPGGWLIATCENRAAISVLLEPMHSPILEPIRRIVSRTLRRIGWRKTPEHGPRPRMQSRRSFDDLVRAAGLHKHSSRSYGFGPFSVFNRQLPDHLGLPLDRRLQALADRNVPLIRSAGVGYMVLAQKPTNSGPPV